MKIMKVPKPGKPGQFRTLYVPSAHEAWACRIALGKCVDALITVGVARLNRHTHGFFFGRNAVTNALCHVGWRYTLSFDLKDFFDHVTPDKLPESAQHPCFFVDGAARQGLPSSPALSNLAARRLDEQILQMRWRTRLGWNFVYTRYADDLTLSYNLLSVGAMLRSQVPAIVQSCGFVLNDAKTQFQSARGGRRHITGVAVDETGVHPTRHTKRRLRAMRHALAVGRLGRRGAAAMRARSIEHVRRRGHRRPKPLDLVREQAEGLAQWAACKVPHQFFQDPAFGAAARAATPAQIPQPVTRAVRTPVRPMLEPGVRRFNLLANPPAGA